MAKFKSKHKKYTSRNPISVFLIRHFLTSLRETVSCLQGVESVLDAGCGEGMVLSFLEKDLKDKKVYAVDFDAEEVESAKINLPHVACAKGDIYNLAFADKSFDLVMCTEVLEHLERPQDALKELRRVSKKYCLITVPDEPLWRILNIARGSYITKCGNTPGHIHHWTAKAVKKLVSKHFESIHIKKSMPWTILLCEINRLP